MNYSEEFGTPEWIRTTDLLLRRQTLYPAELRAHENRKSGRAQGAVGTSVAEPAMQNRRRVHNTEVDLLGRLRKAGESPASAALLALCVRVCVDYR
jgi:hypothetical protein